MKFFPLLLLSFIYVTIIIAVKSLCNPKGYVYKRSHRNRVLFKSQNNRIIAGVCGGIAEYFGLNATVVRLLFLFSGIGLITYAILSIIIPDSPSALL